MADRPREHWKTSFAHVGRFFLKIDGTGRGEAHRVPSARRPGWGRYAGSQGRTDFVHVSVFSVPGGLARGPSRARRSVSGYLGGGRRASSSAPGVSAFCPCRAPNHPDHALSAHDAEPRHSSRSRASSVQLADRKRFEA